MKRKARPIKENFSLKLDVYNNSHKILDKEKIVNNNFIIRNNILPSGINVIGPENKDRNFITSLARGLLILEAFDDFGKIAAEERIAQAAEHRFFFKLLQGLRNCWSD